jgi:hypothetical protein
MVAPKARMAAASSRNERIFLSLFVLFSLKQAMCCGLKSEMQA